jgi:hypothetical protein
MRMGMGMGGGGGRCGQFVDSFIFVILSLLLCGAFVVEFFLLLPFFFDKSISIST